MDKGRYLKMLNILADKGYGDKTVKEVISDLTLKETNPVINYESLSEYKEFMEFCKEHGVEVEVYYRKKYDSYFVNVTNKLIMFPKKRVFNTKDVEYTTIQLIKTIEWTKKQLENYIN